MSVLTRIARLPQICLFKFYCNVFSHKSKYFLSNFSQELLEDLFRPNFFLPPELQREYPSHMHIDLMERAQGQGIGTRMLKTLLATLKAKGKIHVQCPMHINEHGRAPCWWILSIFLYSFIPGVSIFKPKHECGDIVLNLPCSFRFMGKTVIFQSYCLINLPIRFSWCTFGDECF